MIEDLSFEIAGVAVPVIMLVALFWN